MKRFLHIGLCVFISLFLSACFDSSEVKQVKGGALQMCPNHTVDQMVKGFMGAPSWTSGKSTDGKVFVNVEGDITFHEKPVRAMLQFIVEGESFSFGAFEMNGVPSANVIAIGMLSKMCESAEGAIAQEVAVDKQAADEQAAKQPSETDKGVELAINAIPNVIGEYTKENGEVVLKQQDKSLNFSINSVVGDNPCNLEGTALMGSEKMAAFADKSSECVVRFDFASGALQVKTSGCDGFCGINAVGSMDGAYRKK